MKKFFEVINITINDEIEKYFENVLVESVKKNKKGALNFYLISNDIIPYIYIREMKEILSKELFGEALDKNFDNVNLFIKYNLTTKYENKVLFEYIKMDIFNELKDFDKILSTIFNISTFEFENDKLIITYDENDMLKSKHEELTKILLDIFKIRFDIQIDYSVKYIKSYNKSFSDSSIEPLYSTNDITSSNENVYKNENSKNNISESKIFINDSDIIYGKMPKSKFTNIDITNIDNVSNGFIVKGILYNYKIENKKDDNFLFSLYIYDGSSCINANIWGGENDIDAFKSIFIKGLELEIYCNIKMFRSEYYLQPICIKKLIKRQIIEMAKSKDYYNIIITDREDNELEKRVELHLHTKYSAGDGIGEVNAYIKTAEKFGMKAIAITDHGCVHALPEAYEYIKKNKIDIKLINGVEGYLVEDFDCYYYNNQNNECNKSHDINGEYIIYEITSSGNNKNKDSIIKVDAIYIKNFEFVKSYSSYVKYDKPLSIDVKTNTNIKESDLINAPILKNVLKEILDISDNAIYVNLSKNSIWSLPDLLDKNNLDNDISLIDMTTLSRLCLNDLKKYDLISIAKNLKIKKFVNEEKNKKSNFSIELIAEVFLELMKKIKKEYDVKDILELKEIFKITDDFIKKQPSNHIILLAKNDVGRVNLYKMVSESYINYMYKKPKIPRSLIAKYREGIIIGSACISGEFMDAIRKGKSDDELINIASYYDYLEIQPTMNNSFLLSEDNENFKTQNDLINLNKKVVEIADRIGKLVVATCDCHYIEEKDKIYREVLKIGFYRKKSGEVKQDLATEIEGSNDENLYFRTTREMLDEFSYLGEEKAYEVVVKNTNIINSKIEDVIPVRLDKCPPIIEGADIQLKNECHKNLALIYGENANNEIKQRLDDELEYIIDNGYAVMYITAKKLIDFSRESGYPVGSRGSVGSSLAAIFAGISEVNPLPPHYVCKNCKFTIYNTEEVNKYKNDTGFDMPDKNCPNCGKVMHKDGVNIPFETFLGIPGIPDAAKEPDIDLNFCSTFQSEIHKKTIELFGENNTFKAGVISTVAKKIAEDYVKKFSEFVNINLSENEKEFYGWKIINCKRTTGQHPGGMVILPAGDDINTFTPVNYPAGRDEKGITTHFDYHKIDKSLLKLDLLGQDSPLLLKKLYDITGVDYNTVPFYDNSVIKLFQDTSSLNITPEDISGTKLGCLTIPEFGTDYAINMCEEAKPKTVADLIRISGIAHGENIWENNLQILIKDNICTLNTAICCRDDIMNYLIDKGIDYGLAFNIMEKVRKGKGLTKDWIEEMKKHDVPNWYIECCNKIAYMFPKAHAAAYVIASLRIAYYKVHYPMEYYTVYFSVKKNGFNYKLMMQSLDNIRLEIEKIKRVKSENNRFRFKNYDENKSSENILEKAFRQKLNVNSSNEEFNDNDEIIDYSTMSFDKLDELYMCYRIVEEMKARKIDFCPIDIYKAKASDFIICDGKIMPSFDTIPGIGTKDDDVENESTAKKCEIEGKIKEYSSIEDFRQRTGVNKKVIAELKKLGILKNLKDSDENTIFDLL